MVSGQKNSTPLTGHGKHFTYQLVSGQWDVMCFPCVPLTIRLNKVTRDLWNETSSQSKKEKHSAIPYKVIFLTKIQTSA